MDQAIDALTLDLVDWLGKRERSYEEVVCIWRSTGFGLPIWKQAIHRGLVRTEIVNGCRIVKPTPLGLIEGELRRQIGRRQ
jgi:hypothetical protein